MRRLVWVVAALIAAGCGGSNDVRFTLTGVVLDAPNGAAVAGATVECPATGDSTVTGADGSYLLEVAVPRDGLPLPGAAEGDDATTPQVGVRFRTAGSADVVHAVVPVEDAEITVVAWLGRKLQTRKMTIPALNIPVTDQVGNASVSLQAGSLVDATGAALAGEAELTAAAWDPSLPFKPATSDVKDDAVTHPYSPAVLALDATAPWVRVLAAAQVDFAVAGVPAAFSDEPGVTLDLVSFNADETFGGISESEVHVYRRDDATGLLVEQENGTSIAKNQLGIGLDAPGTWVWARPVPDATCVTVTVVAGQVPVVGAHVRLVTDALNPILLDEQAGSPGGTVCLRGPSASRVRVEGHLAGLPGQVRTAAAENVLLTGGGGCESQCPVQADLVFPCAFDSDCFAGSICTEGTCAVPAP